MIPIYDYRAVVYSSKEGGDLIYESWKPTWLEAKDDIQSFRTLYKAKYPDMVGSIQNRKTGKWVNWKDL